jgi:RNA polymerase sigma-70 factor (ECF subfamily)
MNVVRSVMAIERDEVATFAPTVTQPDTGRLEALYAHSQRRLVIQIAALTGDISVAEDLVQEAFGRCVARWAQVACYDDPEAWVRSVAYNLARSRWRRLKRGARALARLGRVVARPVPEYENVGLMMAVSRLAEDEQEVIVRHYLLDQPIAVVSAQLGIPEGTVKSRLARARGRLAEMLGTGDTGGAAAGDTAGRAAGDTKEDRHA